MSAHRHAGQMVWRCFVVLLSVILALQTPGASRRVMASSSHLQAWNQQQLNCEFPKPLTTTTRTYCNLQIVFMIDNSGSMRTNDRYYERDVYALDWLDILAQGYYLAALEAQKSNPDLHVPDVQVAIIHFSDRVMNENLHWIKINPADLTEWKTQRGKFEKEINQNQNFAYTLEPTLFSKPLEAAKNLWTLPDVQDNGKNCIRRSIMLFTDGTPEDAGGRYAGNRFTSEMSSIERAAAKSPPLDGIYVVGFDSTKPYQNDTVHAAWQEVISKVSASQRKIPRFVLRSSEEFNKSIGEIKKYLSEYAQSESTTASWEEENLLVNFESEPLQLQANLPRDIKFKIVASGIQPGSTVKLQDVSVTPADQQSALPLTQSGDVYQFSWTPKSTTDTRFNVAATFVNDKDATAVCSGSVSLDPPDVPDPTTIPISLVIMPPREAPTDVPIILPMRLNFEGDIKSVQWKSPHAKVLSRDGQSAAAEEPLTVKVESRSDNVREANLIVGPVGAGKRIEIEAGVTALVNIGNQDILIPDATSEIVIRQLDPICNCSTGLWGFWFWPLLIVLVGLMILLLVFRARSRRDEPDDEQADRDIFRRSDWHLLFWPLPVLFILLLLVRLMEWCCIIPPWLFLVAILAWVVMLLFLRFTPGHGDFPRPRPWWLVLLLLALMFVGFLTITVPLLTLLWLLLILVATWLTPWYIRPYRPVPHELAGLSLAFAPQCVPFNESLTLPLQVDFQGMGMAVQSLSWSVSVNVMSGGEVGARVVPLNEAGGEYELIIDPINYDKNAREIQVRVGAQAILASGRSIQIQGPMTRIEICQPDDLAELEGIGEDVRNLLYRKGILTFKQLAGAVKSDIINLLDQSDLKMMDPKTWPQQARLAHIAREFGGDEKKNYEAYKAWLRNGIEPDEYDLEETDRRPDALVWNKIAQFTPLVLNLALSTTRSPIDVTKLPIHVRPNGDKNLLSAIDWKVSAETVPGGAVVGTMLNIVDPENGKYELVIDPVAGADEIQVSVQATVNGRSIEFYNQVVAVQIPFGALIIIPPVTHDDLTELEGIEKSVQSLLNANNIRTFQELAEADPQTIDGWLKEKPWGKMMDPKTWPQQAKLADIAKRYGNPADKQNYEAYKSWLKDGIEPDEHNNPEKPRRPVALPWNGIPHFTPVVLSVPLPPSSVHRREAITLPMQLDHDAMKTWLSDIEWKVSAKAIPGGTDVEAKLQAVNPDQGAYELVIAPVQPDGEKPVEEIQVTVQALVNGRSIEIYGEAVTVQISAPPVHDNLEELEGIGPAVQKVLNQHKVFTFKQLANTDPREISGWLNAAGLKMMDPKTWPQQARLADIARKYGREEDVQSYQAYKAWLKNGIEPDEVKKDEKDRRPVALPWPLTSEFMPDRLDELEGIGPAIAEVLNDNGIFTFRQLARADIRDIESWLKECGYERMDPKTWPQQAKLADIARKYERAEDQQSYENYRAWLKAGIEPDEAGKPENERRPAALVWYGTAEQTESVYADIFKK